MISTTRQTILQLTCIYKSTMLPGLLVGKPVHKQGLKRRKTWLRRLTLGVGLLCLVSHASSTLHMLLVEHMHCAEHGELVHAAEDHGHDHSIVATWVSTVEETFRASAQTAEHGHGHADCKACSERRKFSGMSFSADQRDASFHEVLRFPLGTEIRMSRASAYRSAPKTSPPA